VVLGVDGAGVIEEIGSGVVGWNSGDRVHFHVFVGDGYGTFADYCLVNARVLVRVPSTVSFQHAAALPCAAWTAYKALRKLHADYRPGKPIIIGGGNGGVGGFAIQLARLYKLNPILTTCSPTSNDRVKLLGATHTIDYHLSSDKISSEVNSVCPKGVDFVVDTVSSASVTSLVPSLTFDGEVACCAGSVNRSEEFTFFLKGLSIHDISLGAAAYRADRLEILSEIGTKVMKLLEEGKLDPMVTQVIKLKEIPEILENVMAKGKAYGKIVVDVIGS